MVQKRTRQVDLTGEAEQDVKSVDLGKFHPGNKLNDLTGRQWIKATKSWFILNPSPRSEDAVLHPAKYPEELVKEFVLFFTKQGQNVVDPFLGTGSTLVACNETLRHGFGVELIPKWAEIAIDRTRLRRVDAPHEMLQSVIVGDSRDIDKIAHSHGWPPMHFCMTSPPYANILRTSRGGVESVQKQRAKRGLATHYSEDRRDLGNLDDVDSYLQALVEVFEKTKRLMVPKSYVTVVLQNVRTEEGEMEPLAWEFAMRMKSAYSLKQERIWCQDNKPLGIWGYPTEYVANVHHHYCLIFQRP